jgi:tetratricopeptide (TPR) repeat protein
MKRPAAFFPAPFLAVTLALRLALSAAAASAGPSPNTLRGLEASLERWDVENAWPAVLEALAEFPNDPSLLELASGFAFYRGDYEESLRLIRKSMEAGGEDERKRGFSLFVESSLSVIAPFTRYETSHFTISLDRERDGILLEYLADALEKTYSVMAERHGFRPEEKVRVELFPDARAFYLASSLSVRDIEATGAVGLTKFNKLQFLSPGALVHGYRWLDAISHEYMHYLIVKLTANKAPVWFHEGLAKYEETRWRSGPDYLSPVYGTLLARAQSEGKLIGFDRMEPSLLRLDSPEDVQLAYAQAASAVEYIVRGVGLEGLGRIMDRMSAAGSKGAADAIGDVMGLEFREFEGRWKEFLASKQLSPLPGATVYPYRVREGEVDGERMDLEEVKSQVARSRAFLGDRLRERGRTSAAVLEYERALSQAEGSVPVMLRLSSALIDLGRREEAVSVLARTLELAPDHPAVHAQLGRVFLEQKEYGKARDAFVESVMIDPFNPDVHAGLAAAFETLGELKNAAKERGAAARLRGR